MRPMSAKLHSVSSISCESETLETFGWKSWFVVGCDGAIQEAVCTFRMLVVSVTASMGCEWTDRGTSRGKQCNSRLSTSGNHVYTAITET